MAYGVFYCDPNLRIMRIAILALISLCLAAGSAFAQPVRSASYEKMIETANKAMENHDYYNALEWYEKAYEEKEDDSLVPLIAEMHYQLRDYSRAERWYSRLLRRDRDAAYVDKRFDYGRILKMNEKYPEAITELQQFVVETDNDSLRTLAKIEITGAEMAMEMPQTNKGATIENAGRDINGPLSEYSAVITRDGNTMYFTGFEGKEVIYFDEVKEENYARVFTSAKGDRGWGKPEPLSDEINRPGFHTSNVALSPDNNTMFFTRAQMEGNVLSSSELYYSVGGHGNWEPAREVMGVNGDYVVKHPAVGELFGREVLFFVSNMPGGHGGYDLYYATREGEGTYSAPVNLGTVVNSIGDESSPYYRDGTLYFSSTGHPGIGGYDIFYSTWDGQRWSEPTNLGYGYNTSVDDRFFALDPEGYKGVLISNRPGGRSAHGRTCCDDIYTLDIARIYADLIVGLFTEDKQVLKGGTVSVVPMQNNRPGTPNKKTSETGNRFDFDLELDMPYLVVAEHPDYYADTAEFNTAGLTASKTFEERFYLKAKPKPPAEPLYDTITIEEPIVLENILYDFDSDRIRPEAETDLQVVLELLNQYPEMVIELRSHTDYRGDDAYNLDLSQRRAESARRWLIRAGIPRARMEAKGYGETVPYTVKAKDAAAHPFLKEDDVLTQAYIDKLASEQQREVAHELNRRTEFQILEGPTSIIIERQRLKKQDTNQQPDRQALPGSQTPAADSLQISKMSSLYGRKDLQGVPIMHFEERAVDFGKVKKGEKRQHTFVFVNKGDTPLVISGIAACDCTTTEYSSDPVNPGDQGKIEVTFDSTEKEEAETITLDIILENTVPDTGNPIIERIQYSFDLLK